METSLAGVLILEPARHEDERGFLSEVFSVRSLEASGVQSAFVQQNHTYSRERGTVRGLHFQVPPSPAAKLVRVVRGSIFDVAVDVRVGSPTFGSHVGEILSSDNWRQMYVPEGFAHGFCTLEDNTEVTYWTSGYWAPDQERGLLWSDPALGIDWPVEPSATIVSPKDRSQPSLSEVEAYPGSEPA